MFILDFHNEIKIKSKILFNEKSLIEFEHIELLILLSLSLMISSQAGLQTGYHSACSAR